MKEVIFVITMLLCLKLATSDTAQAFYYTGPYVPSYCFNTQQNGEKIVKLGNRLWNEHSCGNVYKVWCKSDVTSQPCTDPRGTTFGEIVEVVGPCDDCNGVDMLLSQSAFFNITTSTVPFEITYSRLL
ncbi:hypothetical protein M5K25_003010 [Dendrobium thyrsiflorum]|uniref:Expansin-like EG45 domain-containing protein n=1 Tax=Dendrobium thyrsiflorum TaxID=117978 RepID=A0ABD0VNX2_DENTH